MGLQLAHHHQLPEADLASQLAVARTRVVLAGAGLTDTGTLEEEDGATIITTLYSELALQEGWPGTGLLHFLPCLISSLFHSLPLTLSLSLSFPNSLPPSLTLPLYSPLLSVFTCYSSPAKRAHEVAQSVAVLHNLNLADICRSLAEVHTTHTPTLNGVWRVSQCFPCLSPQQWLLPTTSSSHDLDTTLVRTIHYSVN